MINEILHAKTGPLTRELLREPGEFGLGQLPVVTKPDATTNMVCGYCSTGCGLTIHLKDGEAVNLSIVPARTIFNASLGIEGDGYSIQLWGKNLTDKKYVSNAVVQQPNVAYNAYLGERATFGITLTARY